jgi:hypothetical protein
MVRVGTVVRTLVLCGLAFSTLAFAKTNKGTSSTSVTYPSGFAVSRPVLELPIDEAIFPSRETPEPRPGPLRFKLATGPWQQEDPVLQKEALPAVSASPGVSFDGIPSPGYVPSDSNLAVGPSDIVEVVNIQFAVYNKSGATLAGPINIQTLFTPLGGDCGTSALGDPVVLYDRQADRWVVSMIGSGATTSECVAVSKTNDPTGSYFLYSYSFGANLNDYPKLSTWATASNSAYLATYNIFQNFQAFIGADICGLDRSKMLAGDPSAAELCKMTPSNESSYLPSDMDGPTPPVDGTPGLFVSWQDNNPGQLYLRKLTLNFATATATLSAPTTISVANDSLACGNGGQCVPQAGTTQTLDTLGDRMMYRFAIRHFADHDRAVVNHAVANGSQVAIRWYELYDPAGSVTLNQQGTFAPDTTYRWMGSVAEDQNGDIGLGYSASSTSIHPAIRFTGRVPSDPLGTMETEATIVQGAGSQVGAHAERWGDYTAMQVDPIDDCTFWYVDQYQAVTGTRDWHTNIASFAFSTCAGTPNFELSPSPSSLTITQGSNGTSTITITPQNGFSGNVTLSASGLPSGVTAAFSPNPASTTSTLTLTASGTAATGTVTVTIKGTSGALTNTTTLSLTVNPVATPDFSLTAAPTSVTVVQGSSGTSTITVVPVDGFSGSVTLSASGLPSGVTAGFSPNPTTSTSTLTLTASATATTGTVTVTVKGVSGSLTHTTTLSLTVNVSGGSPAVSLSPTSETWGAIVVGVTTPPKAVTLTNSGTATLNISNIATSGDFALSTSPKPCGSALVPGKNCKITITFTPTQDGMRTGSLTITDNASNSPQTVPLSGTGVPQATLTPASLLFPPQKVGTTSAARTLTLTNKELVPVNNIVISTTGDFSVSTTTCTMSLAVKATCKISVVFSPTAVGTRTGSVSVSDTANNSPQTSSLSGTGN